ncbi:MAG: hypothetical protein FJ399_15380 [Verrucomicrobia bacterium]|nr:hypothetical protein [Verrucomicrobiota bacterium]
MASPACCSALFHLRRDPAEQNDLTAAEPATARRLQQAWRDWSAAHLPPAAVAATAARPKAKAR